MKPNIKNLTAKNLQETLWNVMNLVQDKAMSPSEADSIAGMAREIIRTQKLQLQIARESSRPIPAQVLQFSEEGK